MKMSERWRGAPAPVVAEMPEPPTEAADVLIEIGVEEMPADDVAAALEQVKASAPLLLDEMRLARAGLEVWTTPRRIVVIARQVAPRQADEEFTAKGPPADRAFDADGTPTRAALGFARGKGVEVADLKIQEIDGGRYVTAVVRNRGGRRQTCWRKRCRACLRESDLASRCAGMTRGWRFRGRFAGSWHCSARR